jgi:hypothetical protein
LLQVPLYLCTTPGKHYYAERFNIRHRNHDFCPRFKKLPGLFNILDITFSDTASRTLSPGYYNDFIIRHNRTKIILIFLAKPKENGFLSRFFRGTDMPGKQGCMVPLRQVQQGLPYH